MHCEFWSTLESALELLERVRLQVGDGLPKQVLFVYKCQNSSLFNRCCSKKEASHLRSDPRPHFMIIRSRPSTMCKNIMIKYLCECVKVSEFVQCQEAKDSNMNIKCRPIQKKVEKISTNYCAGHLVYPTAAKKYFSDPEE
ncbi:hypothetical protein F4824DRAFT_226057 [Ustulina deusta]|nr:hypothetical protein F4824DRAFT_226057 [Ustulina deusta]